MKRWIAGVLREVQIPFAQQQSFVHFHQGLAGVTVQKIDRNGEKLFLVPPGHGVTMRRHADR
ncbi:MAG: hypothetical protein M0P70_05425 [Desulfobulbaceae bacterium]|nr:hypothetical protein [Desulfobulbaceae bacterium]